MRKPDEEQAQLEKYKKETRHLTELSDEQKRDPKQLAYAVTKTLEKVWEKYAHTPEQRALLDYAVGVLIGIKAGTRTQGSPTMVEALLRFRSLDPGTKMPGFDEALSTIGEYGLGDPGLIQSADRKKHTDGLAR